MYRLILILMLLPILAFSSEEREENSFFLIPKGSTHSGDYFAAGSGIEISGTVQGDAYLAGSSVLIDGTVEGDVLVTAGSVEVSGNVKGNVRAISGQLLISGSVGKSVSACCGNVHIIKGSSIGSSVVAVGGNVELAGNIGGDATIASSNLRLASLIQGGVQAYTGQIRVSSSADIQKSLSYTSRNPIIIEPQALIQGGVKQSTSSLQTFSENRWVDMVLISSKVAGVLMNMIFTFVLGMILMKISRQNAYQVVHFIQHKPLRSLLHGVLVTIVVPLICLLLLMTILGVPFALTLIAANVLGFYSAKIYVILGGSHWLSQKMRWRTPLMLNYGLGVIVYFILLFIPYLGGIISIVSMFIGLGAMVTVQLGRREKIAS